MLTGQTALRTCVLLILVPLLLEKIQFRFLQVPMTKNYAIPVSAVNVDNEIPEDVTETLSSEQQANFKE